MQDFPVPIYLLTYQPLCLGKPVENHPAYTNPSQSFAPTSSGHHTQIPESKQYQNLERKDGALFIHENSVDADEDLVTPTIEQLSILDEKVMILQKRIT